MTVQTGDWVAFMNDGGIVYARVEYIQPRASWERSDKAVTTQGKVPIDQVLEVRSKAAAVSPLREP